MNLTFKFNNLILRRFGNNVQFDKMSNKKRRNRRNKRREKKRTNRRNKQRKKKIQSLDTGHRPVSNHSKCLSDTDHNSIIECFRPKHKKSRFYNNELMYNYDSGDSEVSEDHWVCDSEDSNSEPEADIEMMSKTDQETQQICDSLILEYLHENELYDTAAFLEEKRKNFYTLKLKKEDEISEPLSMIIENFKPQPLIGGIVLPQKCLIQILFFLDFKTVQKVCTRVSKSWLELIRSSKLSREMKLPRIIQISLILEQKDVNAFLHSWKNLRVLHFSSGDEPGRAFIKCLKTHKSLEQIVIPCQIDLYEDGRSLRWV